MANLGILLACVLSVQPMAAGAAKRAQWPTRRPTEPTPSMPKATVRCAYRLMEATCPFPCQRMEQAAPLAWKCAAALGSATSWATECVFTHLLILISLVLNALSTKYGGILGKFPNLLMIQHGAPGEGKSVALWMMFQILYYFDSLRTKIRLAKWRVDHSTWKTLHQEWKDSGEDPTKEPEEPQKPERSDSVSYFAFHM